MGAPPPAPQRLPGSGNIAGYHSRTSAHHLCVHEMNLKGVTVDLVDIYVAILERRLRDDPVTVFRQNSSAIWEQRFPACPVPIFLPSFSPDEERKVPFATSCSSFRKWIPDRKKKHVRFADDNCVDSHQSLPTFMCSGLTSGHSRSHNRSATALR
jgi:hypothetical protein